MDSKSLTPMMQQYQDAKALHPGMLLLFRMGDFYEMFGDDVDVAERILGLTRTSRDKSIPMAGFPHHALQGHLQKLLQAGCRVAICDQVEDAAQAKGLVKREVTRVVTPGTLTEDELLDPKRANHLAAIHITRERVGLAWVELSSGLMQAFDVPADRLNDELNRLAPSELLFAEKETPHPAWPLTTLSRRPDWNFDPASARAALFQQFHVTTMAGFGFENDANPCLIAAGALVLYLRETLKAELAHLHRIKPYSPQSHLVLDEVTRRSLELTQTLRDGKREGSVLSVLDRTVTSMGARLLTDWLVNPLAERSAIETRLDAVEELLRGSDLRRELRESLQEGYDLQRLTTRVSTLRASPRDLSAIGKTLRLLPRVKAKLTKRKSALLNELEKNLELCPDLRQSLEAALVDDPPQNPREGGIIREGFNAALDELRGIARGGKDWIARFQADEITRTGINSLKVGFNKVFGYYIEITHANAGKIPADYIRKQTLKNAERYITPELKAYEEKVLSAEEKIHQLEYELFVSLRDRVAQETLRLLATAEVLAIIDVLCSLAEVAASRQYTRPELLDEPTLEIYEGRHPVLEQTLPPGTFVPNDVILAQEHGLLWLITGPNMAGKSTFIRQVALLTLMAHVGCFLPARRSRIGLTDRIFTRVGASDELSRGLSTFMVEMTEAANILNNATERSLVILDEIGRGTSTYDGVSLAWSICEYLHNQLGSRALFATHYHELAQLAESLPRMCNYNVQVREWKDDIIFLHKIAPGSADKSYGIHVARLAGVPKEVLERAQLILTELEEQHQLHPAPPNKDANKPRMKRRPKPTPTPGLFAEID